MSLRRSTVANYGSQLYTSFIAVLMLPVYVRYMGPEGYGLVGIFIAMQGWFQALDSGLSALLTYQVARWRGGIGRLAAVTAALRRLEVRFLVFGTITLLVVLVCSPYVSNHWLKRDALPLHTISQALVLMCSICLVRWLGGIYRGVIAGFEQFGRLGLLASLFASLRFIGVVPVMAWAGDAVSAFFWFQLVANLAECGAIAWFARRGLVAAKAAAPATVSDEAPVADRLGWQMTLATLGWLVATQADRLLLSRQLPLPDFGRFSLALAAAGGLMVLTAPAGQMLMPRMSRLQAAGEQAGLSRLYSAATQAVVVVTSALTATLVVCAEPILWAWTGDRDIALRTQSILVPYAIGNGLLVIGSMPYHLQFARGDLRLHNVGTGLLIALLLPGMVIAASHFGGQGTGVVWAVALALYLLVWTPIVHRRHLPGAAPSWLANDVLPVLAAVAAMGMVAWVLVPRSADGRIDQLPAIVATGVMVTAAAVAASPWARATLRSAWVAWKNAAKKGMR
jgi:O-antigen/teichoic acid export membrane protein